MPSTDFTKALSGLDVEQDQRDWIGQFPMESASNSGADTLQRESSTLFTVVRYERPMPIVLPEPELGVETRPSSGHHHRSLVRRLKRAITPALTALLVTYIAVVFITAWIGVKRSEALNRADASRQMPTDAVGPGNQP